VHCRINYDIIKLYIVHEGIYNSDSECC